jgi:NAD(P)-dependent dehydrogenase (short-subunit alcohol dehydrogenase family)
VSDTLLGKTVLITGASSGFGAHFASVLADAHANVILAARRIDALEGIASALRKEAVGTVRTLQIDVTECASVDAAAEIMGNIDVLVNNAGLVRPGTALSQSEEDWNAVVDTNLKGSFFVARAAARAMCIAKKGGSIINISSIVGERQVGGVLPYAVSKAGVIQMTKVLALEWARFDIRVNALAPGYFETDLNRAFWDTAAGKALIQRVPQRRLGHLSDLDGPLLLLASDASRFMTGCVLVVDGGHLVSGL